LVEPEQMRVKLPYFWLRFSIPARGLLIFSAKRFDTLPKEKQSSITDLVYGIQKQVNPFKALINRSSR
jgi:hypothetical protein